MDNTLVAQVHWDSSQAGSVCRSCSCFIENKADDWRKGCGVLTGQYASDEGMCIRTFMKDLQDEMGVVK